MGVSAMSLTVRAQQPGTASALGVARRLTATLPRVEVKTFDQLGHMGPVTHADEVNAVIEQFLVRHG